jgi:N-acetyl sugar amidotransferase
MTLQKTEDFDTTWCSKCLTMSTRPRITFDSRGYCNACIWAEEKTKIDWDDRLLQLNQLLNKHKKNNGDFDCLVPVSGGKDGSYVAYNLKHRFGMNPLCVTITPALPLPLGESNLRSFVESGYDHLTVNPDYEAMRLLNKTGFIEMGFPYYGWLTAITVAPIKIALAHNINLIFYGEDGEVEYGGSTETSKNPIYSTEYQKRVYLEGGYERVLQKSGLGTSQLNFFTYPKNSLEKEIELTHWSYFENWDPYRNYLVAKEFCGLKESDTTNEGTFTNFSQNDQALYALHTYLMYLKFGFGRANQDACIEIRRGAMTRHQALNLVSIYDGEYPEKFINLYLDYYQISQSEFDEILDKFVNRNLFTKVNGRWQPNFKIK